MGVRGGRVMTFVAIEIPVVGSSTEVTTATVDDSVVFVGVDLESSVLFSLAATVGLFSSPADTGDWLATARRTRTIHVIFTNMALSNL